MKTTTIRVGLRTRDRLNALARRRGAPAGQVVDELVREADDQALLEAAAESWDRLAESPETLAAYREEAGDLERFVSEIPGD